MIPYRAMVAVSHDPDLLALLGKTSIAWARVDWTLRACLRWIEGVTWESQRGVEIQELPSHQAVINEINTALGIRPDFPNAHRIVRHTALLGMRRHELLYGRRNKLLHSLFVETEHGEIFSLRPGGDVVQVRDEPKKVAEMLISDLEAWRRELTVLLDPPRAASTSAVQRS